MDTKFLFGMLFSLIVIPGRKFAAEGINLNGSSEVGLPTYRVATVLNDPWMMQAKNGYEGILVDLLNEVAKLANFTYVIKTPPNKAYGRTNYMSGEIQVNGIIGEIISGEADLGVADLTISDERLKVVSFSRPFATTGGQILLRRPDNDQRSFGMIFLPFSPSLWACIGVALLITTSVIYAMERLYLTSQHKSLDIVQSFQLALSACLLRGRKDSQESVSSRLISLTWRAFSLIILITYTASLSVYLLSTSASKPQIPFKTFEEMAGQSDVQYGGWFEMDLNLNDNIQRSIRRHISSKHTYYSNIDEAVGRVLNTDNPFAAIVDGYNGQKAINQHCELLLLQEQLFEIDYGIACSRDHVGEALCSDISMAIRTLRIDGLLHTIMNKWWRTSEKCEKVSENDFITSTQTGSSNIDFKALEIYDVFVAFFLLMIGIFMSTVTAFVSRKNGRKKSSHGASDSELEANVNHREEYVNTVPEAIKVDEYTRTVNDNPELDV